MIKVTAYISKVIITEEIFTFPDTEPASIRVRSIFLDGTPICRGVGGPVSIPRSRRWDRRKALAVI